MATARLEELKARFDENPRRYFAPYANELRKSGDLAQAIAICRTHLATQPGHVSGHIVLAQALHEAGEIDDARGTFDIALSIDPENLIALRYMGDIARERGDVDDARVWYGRVLDADPRNDEIAALLRDLASAPNGSSPQAMQPPVIVVQPTTVRPSEFAPPSTLSESPAETSAGTEAAPAAQEPDVSAAPASWNVELPPSDFAQPMESHEAAEGSYASTEGSESHADAATPPHVRAVSDETPEAAAPSDDDLLYWNGDIDQSLAEATRDLTSTWQPQATPAAHFSDFEAAPEPWPNEILEETFDSGSPEFLNATTDASRDDVESWFDEPAPTPEPETPAEPARAMPDMVSPTVDSVDTAPITVAGAESQVHEESTHGVEGADSNGHVDAGDQASAPVVAHYPTPTASSSQDDSWWTVAADSRGTNADATQPDPSAAVPERQVAAPEHSVAEASSAEPEVAEPGVEAEGSAPAVAFVPEVRDRPTRPSLTSVSAIPESPAPSPAPFVTETLAELYVKQGFREEAIAIYRQLVEREPGSDRLRQRLDALERGEMPAASPAAGAPHAAGVSVRAFFSRLAQRKPSMHAAGQTGSAGASSEAGAAYATEVPPDHTPLAQLFAAARPSERDASAASTLASAFSEPAGFSVPGGRPARLAERELSLDHLFRDRQKPSAETGSMDEFYSSPASNPPSSPSADARGQDEGGDDLHQFTAWLEGLKKK